MIISAVGQIQQLLPMKAVHGLGGGRFGEGGIRWLMLFRLQDICFCHSVLSPAYPVPGTFFSCVLEQVCSCSQGWLETTDRRKSNKGSRCVRRSLWTKCWMQCTQKSLSHLRAWKAIKLFLKWLRILLSRQQHSKEKNLSSKVCNGSFEDYLGVLNTDLISAYDKFDFWRIVPTLGNKLVFFISILASLGYTENKLNFPIKSLDLVYLFPSGIANLELSLQ